MRVIFIGIQSITNCYQPGLQALGKNSKKVKPQNSRICCGSVDLDSCLKAALPNDPRWDYIICYNEQIYFVEVHPASTSQVQKMIDKANWLKRWLVNEGAPLAERSADVPFQWVGTKDIAVFTGTTYARKLITAGIALPKRELVLPQPK